MTLTLIDTCEGPFWVLDDTAGQAVVDGCSCHDFVENCDGC